MMHELTDRFVAALNYATHLHRSQFRKGERVPYISHLYAVAGLVMEAGGSEDEVIGALLHDAVEDQGGLPRLEEIRQQFGDQVAEIVDGCTDAYEEPKPLWRPRKEAYVAHITAASDSVRLVSNADKLHNARSILADFREVGEAIWDRFSASRDETLWYYRSLADLFSQCPANSFLARELDRTVTLLEEESRSS